jgi:hypothetical protein
MTFQSPFTVRQVPAYVLADIVWWHTYALTWNGIRLITPSYPTVHVYTDASRTKGIGGIHGSLWFSSRVLRHFRKRDIQFKEIYAVLQAILCWGHLWRHHHVIFHVDNEAIVDAITKETNRSRFTMTILRPIVMLAAFLDFSFSSCWLSSAQNALADAASQFQYAHLFNLAPYLNKKSSLTSPQLSGIKRTLTSRPRSHSSSGTGSPPEQGRCTAPDSAHTSTSSPCALTFSILTVHSTRPTKLQSWNGSHTLDTRKGFLHQQLRCTLVTSSHCTQMPIFPSMPLNPPLPSGSSGESNGTLAIVPENPLRPSPSKSFVNLSRPPGQILRSMRRTWTLPSSLPFQASCVPGNSRSKGINSSLSNPLRTSQGVPSNSSLHSTTLPMLASLSQPRRLIPSAKASPSSYPPWTRQHAPSKLCDRFSFATRDRLTPPCFATRTARHCSTPPSSTDSVRC